MGLILYFSYEHVHQVEWVCLLQRVVLKKGQAGLAAA
jgi:hypothetical protein